MNIFNLIGTNNLNQRHTLTSTISLTQNFPFIIVNCKGLSTKIVLHKNNDDNFQHCQIDSYLKRMSQKCLQFFINEKLKKFIYFFTCILPKYVPYEITKEFWKISHFENMTAGFLLRGQNSLRWEICLICHWNIDSWKQKLSIGYVMVQKIVKNHLDTTQITFSENNNY